MKKGRVFCVLVLAFTMVFYSSFSVFGATYAHFTFVEPPTSSTSGYLAVMDSYGDRCVFYWSIQPYSWSDTDNNGSLPSMNITLNDSSIEFNAVLTGSGRVTLTRIYNNATQTLCMSRNFTLTTQYTYTGMTTLQYYAYAGNLGIVNDNMSSTNNYLSCVWGDSQYYISEFNDVVSKLSQIDSSIDALYERLGSTNGYIDGIEGKLDALISSQGFDNLEDLLKDIENNTDLIEDKLDNLYGQIDWVEEYLEDIESEIDYVEEYLKQIRGYVDEIEGWLHDIYVQVDWVEEYLEQIENNTDYIEEYLDEIEDQVDYVEERLLLTFELLEDMSNAVGQENTDSLDDSSIGSLEDGEDQIISDSSDAVDDLEFNFGSAFDTVWDLVSSAWQSNSKVFTIVIMCLTVGVIKLILNR